MMKRKLNNLSRYILLILALWIFFYFGLFPLVFVTSTSRNGTGFPFHASAGFDFIMFLAPVTMGVMLAAYILYITALFQNQQIDGNAKLLWLLGFLFAGPLFFPIYWWKYVKIKPETA